MSPTSIIDELRELVLRDPFPGYAARGCELLAQLSEFFPPQPMMAAAPRSPKWPACRKAHLERHPVCAGCGGTKDLQVHHLRPYHLHPELELDPANLITLCEAPSHNCHFIFGHTYLWAGYNPSAAQDAANNLARIPKRVDDGGGD